MLKVVYIRVLFKKLRRKSTSFGQLAAPVYSETEIVWIDHALSLIHFIDAIQRWAEQKSQESFNVEITFLIPLTSLLLFSTLLFTSSSLSITMITIITLLFALTLLQISKYIYEISIKQSPDIAQLKDSFINNVKTDPTIEILMTNTRSTEIINECIAQFDVNDYMKTVNTIDKFTHPNQFIAKLNNKCDALLQILKNNSCPSPVRGIESQPRKRPRIESENKIPQQPFSGDETVIFDSTNTCSEASEIGNKPQPLNLPWFKDTSHDRDGDASSLTSNESGEDCSFESDEHSAFVPPKPSDRSSQF